MSSRPGERGVHLELDHAAGHGAHTALQGGALPRSETIGQVDDASCLVDELTFGVLCPQRQQRTQLRGEVLRIGGASQDLGEHVRERQFLLRCERDFVFDGVGNTAQQVGIAHHIAEPNRQLWNGQREGARHPLQHVPLEF